MFKVFKQSLYLSNRHKTSVPPSLPSRILTKADASFARYCMISRPKLPSLACIFEIPTLAEKLRKEGFEKGIQQGVQQGVQGLHLTSEKLMLSFILLFWGRQVK